ncbi:MAG: hypothetical protein MUQ65_16900 [Armatimonadetes bacterium]|nr:hypothetical protein [Armatimonadota bacterium]
MNLTDRNKMLIAGGVAVVAILLVAFFVLRGRKPKESAVGAGAFTQGEAVETTAAGEAPAAPGAAAPAAAGGEAPAATTAGLSVGVVQMGIGPAEPTRPDPFLSFEPPTQPTPPELLVSLPPVGVVAGGLRPGGITTAGPRVGNRRVAGLLFNDQAWAILEDEDGETFIVKPGDVVDGIRITALSRDSIFLMDRDGMRWEVPLRGLGPGSTVSTASSTVSAMPSVPPA